MNTRKLVIRNLTYFWKKNLTVVLGIAIASAVLTGALMVGDSVVFNLKRIINLRLGNVDFTLNTGERFITAGLADNLQDELNTAVAPVLMFQGIAVSGGGQKRVNRIQMLGIDSRFDRAMGIHAFYDSISTDEVIVSLNLAARLDVKEGDEVLFRITRASLVPLNTPFVSDEEPIVSANLKIKAIAGDDQIGRFNLRISQRSPFNAFVSLSFLNQLMDLHDRANILLFSGNSSLTKESIISSVQRTWSLEDAGLSIRKTAMTGETELLSERVFLDEPVLDAVKKIPGPKNFILTYFVNDLSSAKKSTPYSFVSTLPDSIIGQNEIIVNKWLADDQGITYGDSIRIKYYKVGPLRRLIESENRFIIKKVVPVRDQFADKDLMPVIPGLSDAGNCRDWDTGVPVKLENIRNKDEKYWEQYRGTPKAFISQSMAEKIWKNPYGSYTAVRFGINEISTENIIRSITKEIHPVYLGFNVGSVRDESLFAANHGVNFSELFIGLSFFVMLAAIILTVLLLVLNLEGRQEQVETLSALGIPHRTIRKVILMESLLVSVTGTLLGIAGAILYTGLVFRALNGIWMDIVRTDVMKMIITAPAIMKGFIFSLVISWIALFFTVRRFLLPEYDKSDVMWRKSKSMTWMKITLITAFLAGLISIVLITTQIISKEIVNAGIFFMSGGLMLLSILLIFYYYLDNLRMQKNGLLNINTLIIKNILRNKRRSLSIIVLLSIGTFIVISTGANRKDLFIRSNERSSGTGGFLFIAESTVPFSRDLNDMQIRAEKGLSGNYNIVQLSRAEGDDASCLNLNRISNPQILGADPNKLSGRFSFVSRTGFLDNNTPWLSLDQSLEDNVIPAIADETVIKWSLGKKVGDTLVYIDNHGNSLNLLLIGGLANSIFQGNVIISNENFRKHFPDKNGSNFFLVDGPAESVAMIEDELRTALRDYGIEIESAPGKLAEFNSVENTYLSIFLVMGALAILIGTAGLGLILARSILERKKEIALFRAVGISRKKIMLLIMKEYIILLLSGILVGAITSTIAILPSLISPNTGISFSSIVFLTIILLVNGILWILLLARIYLKDPAISYALRNE